MKESGGGAIVNVASTSGHRGTPENVAYCIAKGELLNFTRQTAVDLAEHDVRVNTLTPTRTGNAVGFEEGGPSRNTNGFLRDRLGEPIDQANGALFLLSDEADFVNGTELVVVVGYLARTETRSRGSDRWTNSTLLTANRATIKRRWRDISVWLS